jgi:hypothetical protein
MPGTPCGRVPNCVKKVRPCSFCPISVVRRRTIGWPIGVGFWGLLDLGLKADGRVLGTGNASWALRTLCCLISRLSSRPAPEILRFRSVAGAVIGDADSFKDWLDKRITLETFSN